MSSGRRRRQPTVVVLDSHGEEVEEQPAKKNEKTAKRQRQQDVPGSGTGQLQLQLSQGGSQPSEPPPPSQQQQQQRVAGAKPAPKLGIAALLASAMAKPKEAQGDGAAASAGTSHGPQAPSAPEPRALWVNLHAPASEAELVVHKKKVQEIRVWMEWQLESLGHKGVSRVAVVSGPPGCGKSTVLRVLAGTVGFEPCEWQPPTPTLWNEYQLQAGSGGRYMSKLDAFEEFSVRAKLPALSLSRSQPSATGAEGASAGGGGSGPAAPSQQPSQRADAPAPTQQQQAQQQREAGGSQPTSGAGGQRPKLLVVDDLPHAANPEQRARLAVALGDLARTSRFPLVIVATETSGKASQERGLSAAAGSYQGLHKDLIAELEAAQAVTFSLNPVTAINTAKALRAILEREQMALDEAQVLAVAEQAQGDLYNAISTLQFVCTGVKPSAVPAARKGRGIKRKAPAGAAKGGKAAAAGAAAAAAQPGAAPGAFSSRDSTLTMFHAFGKLLYNKRVGAEGEEGGGSPPAAKGRKKAGAGRVSAAAAAAAGPSMASGGAGGSEPAGPAQAEWARRAPMEFDPEAVLAQSGLEAGSVIAYLHQNLPDFVDEPAIADMAGCLDYLSQADCIACGHRYGGGGVTLVDDELPSSTLAEAAAASTAARGVCFSNAHPAPRRFLPLSAPTLFLAEKAARLNRGELERAVAGSWAAQAGGGHLEGRRGLACEMLPYVRSIQHYSRDPRLLGLLPGHWQRLWNGQLYDSGDGGAGVGAALAGLAGETDGAGAPAAAEDAIEDSTDSEEDW